MYPVVRGLTFPTKVVRFLDDTEQRWASGPPLNKFTLTTSHIKWTDVQNLQNFFITQKGAFDSTWTFSINSVTYSNMVFDSDIFTYTEVSPGKFSVSLQISQTQPSGSYATGVSAVYPKIRSGNIIAQFPVGTARTFLTTGVTSPAGLRYSYYWRSSPRVSFPLQYSSVSDADCAVLFDFYTSMFGNLRTFSFVDPVTGDSYAKCRFGMQSLERTFLEPDQNTINVLVEAIP